MFDLRKLSSFMKTASDLVITRNFSNASTKCSYQLKFNFLPTIIIKDINVEKENPCLLFISLYNGINKWEVNDQNNEQSSNKSKCL